MVAVKCIKRNRLTHSSMENILTEIEVMKQLQHEYIVQLTEFEVSYCCTVYVTSVCIPEKLTNFMHFVVGHKLHLLGHGVLQWGRFIRFHKE